MLYMLHIDVNKYWAVAFRNIHGLDSSLTLLQIWSFSWGLGSDKIFDTAWNGIDHFILAKIANEIGKWRSVSDTLIAYRSLYFKFTLCIRLCFNFQHEMLNFDDNVASRLSNAFAGSTLPLTWFQRFWAKELWITHRSNHGQRCVRW